VTAGIQQLGWATLQCRFTGEEGVGDTQYSYAYDGKRRRKWNMRANEYGERWAPGDVVGVCIDLDSCEVRFFSSLLCACILHPSSAQRSAARLPS
jgi:Kip1 ubiquitination-promoting complex protein 1